MDITRASPYASPDTPIASAKRLRYKVPTSGARSQIKSSRSDQTPVKEPASEVTRKLNFKPAAATGTTTTTITTTITNHKSKRLPEPYTPSKNLFSPALRDLDGVGNNNNNGSSSSSSLYSGNADGKSSGSYEDHNNSSKNSNNNNSHYNYSVNASYNSHHSHSHHHCHTPDEEIKQTSSEISEGDDHHKTNNSQHATNMDEEEEEDEMVFNPYLFISELPDHHLVAEVGKICLPSLSHSSNNSKQQHDQLTLVLDLDETLVHCAVTPMADPDLIFPVLFNGVVHQVYVRKRPYLDYFLETVSKSFEVVLFTASQKVYADVLLDKIDPKGQFIKYRLFRESCLFVQGNYLKDLQVLGRDMRKTIIVDNSPYAYGYQMNNGIPIESWYDDPDDRELLKLIGFLKQLHGVHDVRPIIRQHFKTHELVAHSKAGRRVSLQAPPF